MADFEDMETDRDKGAKPVRLNLHLLIKRHLPQGADKWSQEDIIEALDKVTHVRLDREKIGVIDNLELMGDKVSYLYLQQNCIREIKNLDTLKQLTFITLANNQITTIQGLHHLDQLGFLDLSFNLIKFVDTDEIPLSVIILNLEGNPCIKANEYRSRLVKDLGRLKQLDSVEVSKSEKREAGYRAESSSEEEEDEDEDDIDEEAPEVAGDRIQVGLESRLFQQTAADILERSMARTEDRFNEHKSHMSRIVEIKQRSARLAADKAKAKDSKTS